MFRFISMNFIPLFMDLPEKFKKYYRVRTVKLNKYKGLLIDRID